MRALAAAALAAALAVFLAAALAVALAAPAARAAEAPRFQLYFQSTLTDAAYQQAVFAAFARAYRAPPAKQAPAAGHKAVVRALLGREGKLVSAALSLGSGSVPFDEAALAGVRRAAFAPLPRGFAPPSVEVDFHVGWGRAR